jgi:VanZ family protein
MIEQTWRALGWLGVILTLVVSLMPPLIKEGVEHTDKIVHLAGYAVLMFWWAQLVIQKRWKLAIYVALFGVIIEGLQGLTPDRLPDPADALANSSGILLGWLAAHLLPNLPARLAALPARQR